MIDDINKEALIAPNPIPPQPPILEPITNKTMLIKTKAIGKSTLFSILFEMNERKVITITKVIVRTTKLNI